MSSAFSALPLIERTVGCLCAALSGPVESLNEALSHPTGSEQHAAVAATGLLRQLQLRRAAWGSQDGPLDLQGMTALLQGLPTAIAVDLSALPPDTVFPPSAARIVANILLLASESLPGGGEVILAGAAEDLFVRIAGPAAAWPVGLPLCLASEAEAQAALTDEGSLQMALTALFAFAAGIRLSALLPPATPTAPAILRLGR